MKCPDVFWISIWSVLCAFVLGFALAKFEGRK